MIKKTTLLLAFIVSPAMFGMDVAQTYESRRRAIAKANLLGTTPKITTAEYKALLEDKIQTLETAITEAKKAPRALDNLEIINRYTCQIKRLYERLDIVNTISQVEMPQKLRDFKQSDELGKSARRLEAQQPSFFYESPATIRKWHRDQKWVAYQTKHGNLKRKLFSQTERELSAAVLSDDPKAATKIADQIQALEKSLEATTNQKQKARLADQIAWAKAQQKINARIAKK